MERRSASRRPASNRATSSIVALAVPLSIAPRCQESTWPENRTKSSRWPWSSPTRWGMGVHPVRTRVVMRTRSGPRARSPRRRSPSAPRIDRHGVAGIRHAVSGAGVPQIVVTIMLWRWSMRTWIWPRSPACLASPGRAWAAQRAGVLGQIHVLMDHLHNMIVTTIWGTPAPETAWRIPATPCLSILGADGERLRGLLARGPLRVRMTTRVRTGWTPIPHLVGELHGQREDRFVLFSGHVDSWHYGAMDNGTANATMLEVARLLATRRAPARDPLRVLVGALARALCRIGVVRGSRVARIAPALRPPPQRGLDGRARRD